MIDARLHPADVIAHDEEDIWFLSLLLRRGGNAGHRCGGTQHDESAPDCSELAHGCFPRCRLLKHWAAACAQLHPSTVFAFRSMQDRVSGNRSDVLRTRNWPKRLKCAMHLR